MPAIELITVLIAVTMLITSAMIYTRGGKLARTRKNRPDSIARLLGMGGLALMVLVAIHAASDAMVFIPVVR